MANDRLPTHTSDAVIIAVHRNSYICLVFAFDLHSLMYGRPVNGNDQEAYRLVFHLLFNMDQGLVSVSRSQLLLLWANVA